MRRLPPLLALVLGLAGCGAQAKLPDYDQAIVDRKLAAIAHGDFQDGSSEFNNFRSKDRNAAIFESLGQAEAKIPGRELRAISWLAAYLAAEPQAQDRAEVRAKIAALDATSRARITQFVQSYESKVMALPAKDRDETLRGVVNLWATLRDDDLALRTIAHMQDDGPKSDAISSLVEAQTTRVEIQYGVGTIAETRTRLEAAQKLAEQIPMANAKTFPLYHVAFGYLDIAKRQIREGDFAGARESMEVAEKMAATLHDEWGPETRDGVATTEIMLARAQVRKGDSAGARNTLGQAAKTFVAANPPTEKYDMLMDLADAQIEAGDSREATQTLAHALPLVTLYNDPQDERIEIAHELIKAGDITGAWQVAGNNIPPETFRAPTRSVDDALPMVADETEWEFLRHNLDKPWFTACPDFSNYMAMAEQIEKTPVENGHQPAYRPGDQLYALSIVCRTLAGMQNEVDGLLKIQFAP
jgi:hypothetical protein